MGKLFGTDGIRGLWGHHPLTPQNVYLLGHCAGRVLNSHVSEKTVRVVVVRDTRASGKLMVDQLTKGLRQEGIDVYDAGVLCTPAVAYLVQAHHFHSGVVVSASHNPPAFNGIKFFTEKGRKWPDTWEAKVEALFLRAQKSLQVRFKRSDWGNRVPTSELTEDYERFLLSTLSLTAPLNLKVAIDCSNGANSHVAPRVFRRMVKKIFLTGNKPNGKNINVNCGSQATGALSRVVKKNRCDMGVAFDGDGDRVIVVDEKGHVVDGDFIIGLLAKHLKAIKELKNNKAVITVMSNLGLKKALKRIGVRSVETPVGDRFVSEAMRKHKSVLGGEQSGHIILGKYLPSGDGLLTAIHVASILANSNKSISKLVGWMKKYPQILLNVTVKNKKPIRELNGLSTMIKDFESRLGDNGRILVRYSGTEPLLRIMIEGTSKSEITKMATSLASEVKS